MTESECILGFPARDLERIVAELEELAAKCLPRVRSKAVYRALTVRSGRPA
ncbi:MAG: hypothetical protein H5T69_17070 [Chloroflexi bacterium]|nr:hypothetical protein [Chloroflexota bacterium]